MPGPVSGLLARFRGIQRALLVALVLVPVLIVTLALVPALIVLPFLSSRTSQVGALIAQLAAWTGSLLRVSRDE
ncbi:dTMP kinase [Streptomyces sp. NPDC093221]|uniref:dTMP kinase n=1 Tax=Streptomyces sp. NPDC093221 TaxID=3366032 RepID=UPI0037F5B1CF